MNVAISYHSTDFQKYIEESVNEVFEDTDLDWDGIVFLRKLNHLISDVFFECILPNNQDREELYDDDDLTVRFLARECQKLETLYPNASLIGIQPINLKGHLLVVLHTPPGSVFNITCVR